MPLLLKIHSCEITEQGALLITEIDVIDECGNKVRVANITPQLRDFIKTWELDVDQWMRNMDISKKFGEKNPSFKTLVEVYGLKVINDK